MAISMCIPASLEERAEVHPHPETHQKCYDAGKNMCYYVNIMWGELSEFLGHKNNLTRVFEDLDKPECLKKVSLGEYDSYLEMNQYPSNEANLTQGVCLFEKEMAIFTPGVSSNDTNYAGLDFLVYQMDVYWAFFAVIVILFILNMLAALMTRSGPRPSFSDLVKNALTDHLKPIKHHSPIRMLQLALLLSATLTFSVYTACIFKGRTRMFSPKVYETYKSLANDPPDAIAFVPSDHQFFGSGTSANSSKKYFSKIKDKLIEPEELVQNVYSVHHVKRLRLAALFSWRFQMEVLRFLHGLVVHSGISEEEIFIIQRNDPNPLKLMTQLIFGSSITEKPGGKKLLKMAGIFMEQHLAISAWQLAASNYMFDSTYKKAYTSNGFPPDRRLNKYKDLNVASFKPLFALCKWPLILSFLFLVYEMVVYSQIATTFKKRSRIRPVKTCNKVCPRTG